MTRDTVIDVLRTVLDPEMPINIVDLGIVTDVRLESGHGIAHGASYVTVELTPTFVGCPALNVLQREVESRLNELPEVLGVRVQFVNSPAWSVIRITPAGREALRAHGIVVPEAGALAVPGMPKPVRLTVSTAAEESRPGSGVSCPFCGSAETALESRFGPTRCRMIYYCNACRNSFEQLKPI